MNDSLAPSTQVDGDEDLRLAVSPDKAVELQTGEIAVEISVDDLRLILRDNIQLWNWGVRFVYSRNGQIRQNIMCGTVSLSV